MKKVHKGNDRVKMVRTMKGFRCGEMGDKWPERGGFGIPI